MKNLIIFTCTMFILFGCANSTAPVNAQNASISYLGDINTREVYYIEGPHISCIYINSANGNSNPIDLECVKLEN